MLLRASKLFPEDDSRVHTMYCLREKDVAFYAGKRQMRRGKSPEVDTVEGDQGQEGSVLVRTTGIKIRGGRSSGICAGVIRYTRRKGASYIDRMQRSAICAQEAKQHYDCSRSCR